MSHDRFFLDHGAIHDRMTGKHVGMQAEIDWQPRLLTLLNGMWEQITALERAGLKAAGPATATSQTRDISPLEDMTLKLDFEQGQRALALEEKVVSDSNELYQLCHAAIWMVDELTKRVPISHGDYYFVPWEPTEEMLDAGDMAFEGGYIREVWQEMIKAWKRESGAQR